MTDDIKQWESRLCEALREAKIVSDLDLIRATDVAASERMSLDKVLLDLGLVEEENLLPLSARAFGVSVENELDDYEVDAEAFAVLSPSYCLARGIVPIRTIGNQLLLLMNLPSDSQTRTEVVFYLGEAAEIAIASKRKIRNLITSVRSTEAQPQAALEGTRARQVDTDEVSDGPAIRFVNDVLEEAVGQGASDIHFEAQEYELRIRLRLHGVLSSFPTDPSVSSDSILARLKVMANLNVSERRLPQDGRISATVSGRKIDLRVSSVPTSFGESIVCRVLDPKALRLGWARLGFDETLAANVRDIIERPGGLFLVTGPTGSGKTTTLYTAISHLNDEKRKILTVEDPVEYNLPGVEQVQIHDEIGMTFSRALRAFLRQDPNIILVGEIRDQETAEIACRAALVGRMVLSTLHTNTPEGAIPRLLDLGVPRYIVRDVLQGVLGQTLEIIGPSERRLRARLVADDDLAQIA